MAKSLWAKYWQQWSQPIDWAAMAAQVKGPTRKGDKRARWEVDKAQAVIQANKRKRQQAAVERFYEERRQRRRGKRAGSAQAAILRALRPGVWTTRPELRHATGMDYSTLKGATARMVKLGLLEQRQRPGWTDPGKAWVQPARYEFALTARGRAARAYELEKEKAPK